MSVSTLDGATLPDAGPIFVVGRLPTNHLRYARYASLVHPEDTRGVAVLTHGVQHLVDGEPQFRTRSTGATGAELPGAINRLRPRSMTMNCFRVQKDVDYVEKPCKATWNLAGLNAVWDDLDFYKVPEYEHSTPANMVPQVLERCKDRCLPYPSYILRSGRGLLLVWLHDRQKPAMLQVWNAIQKRLHETFRDMGSDSRARPGTMSFGVAGTTKRDRVTKADSMVEVIWPAFADEIERYDFAMLREILPYTPKQVSQYKKEAARKHAAKVAAREARRAAAKAAGVTVPPPKLSLATMHAAVYRDLLKLLEHRHPTRSVAVGERDTWLYNLSVAAAWVMPPDDLVKEIERLSPLCGLRERRGVAMMGSVIRKARLAAKGHTDAFKAGRSDKRYKSKPRELVEDLGVTVREITKLDLRILITPGVKREREAKRSQKRRAEAGVTARSEIQAARLALGRQALADQAAGMSVTAIATAKGVSVSQVRKAMREATAVAAIGKPLAKLRRPKAPKSDAHGSTVSIDACGSETGAGGDVVACGPSAYTPTRSRPAPQDYGQDARCEPTGPAGVSVSDALGEVPEFLRTRMEPAPA